MGLKWFCPFTALLVLASWLHADEGASARDVARLAMKAMGGNRLAGAHAATWKAKGTATINGEEIEFDAKWAIQGERQLKITADAQANGSAIKALILVNGDKGWAALAGLEEEMDKDRLAEEQERAYLDWLATFVPLDDSRLKLTGLGESKVDGRAAVGIKVQRAGRRDVELFFDKDKGLLLKSQMRVKDLMGGADVEQHVFYRDYKEQGGVPRATRVTYLWDKNPYLDMAVSGFKLHKKLPEKLFQKP